MKSKIISAVIILSAVFITSCFNSGNADIPVSESKRVKFELDKNWPQLPAGFILGNATGIGIDSHQNIFVFHRAGRRWTEPFPDSMISANTILVLDHLTGRLINSWGNNLFIMPHGLTVDKKDNIWVTDVALQQVFKFNHDGKLLMKLGEAKIAGNDSLHFNQPTDIAVAKDGSFYVSDGYGNSRIIKFSSTGKYLFEWGKLGNKPGEFNIPHAIDLDENENVFVADRENSRVQVFGQDGKFLREMVNADTGKVYAVAIDKVKNQVAFVDYFVKDDSVKKGSDVIVFSSDEKRSTRFGRSGSYTGPICRYHDLVIDKEGNIYVGDILQNSVQKFKRIEY
jgi:peptidylamidoglycolate lyase